MSASDQQDVSLNNSLINAEIKKTKLEIKNLIHNRRWASWREVASLVSTFAGAITPLLAILGFIFTLYQFDKSQAKEREERYRNDTLMRQEQERGRMNKIESQIRANKELLSEFDADNKISSTRVLFVLDDLGGLIEQLPNPEREQERRRITDILTKIAWDLSYNDGREIQFDVLALRWPQYREYWKADPLIHHRFLFSKYYAPMRDVYAKDSLCIQALEYDPQDRLYISKSEHKACEGGLFQALLHGYLHHLKVISELNDQGLLEKEIAEFRNLTNNPSAANSLTVAMLQR